MSIVERALKKAQQAAAGATNAGRPPEQLAPVVVGRIVENQVAVTPDMPVPQVTSGRTVHIDHDALRAAGLLPPENHERELADQYRAIKRPLLRNALEANQAGTPGSNFIMVGSALPGDGKTFSSINLALSLSHERDTNVLLVDADLPKQHVSELFGIKDERGLLDSLRDPTCSVESVILSTDVPRLSLLPAGQGLENSTEFLASARMKDVLARLARMYARGIVIFDSSPLLLTSEPAVLAAHVGQVVLVVKAGDTPQQAVRDSLEVLGAGKKVSLILNQADLSGPESYYSGYRYAYGYGHGKKNDQDKKAGE